MSVECTEADLCQRQVAERRTQEREKLFDGLIEIRQIIGKVNSKIRTFHKELTISKYAGLLHDALVNALQGYFGISFQEKTVFV